MPVVLGNVAGSFAWHVLHERHPSLVARVRDEHMYTPRQLRGLDRLLEEITTGTITPLPRTAPDHRSWDGCGADHFGRQWPDVPFLWAESYFYRRLLEAVEFFHPGVWHWVDPFERMKAAELTGPALEFDMRAVEQVARLPLHQRSTVLLLAALWGNQNDLGFHVGAAARPESRTGLVADDSAAAWSALDGATPRKICVVMDNAGRELVSDLILVDHLMETGRAEEVNLHVKPHPYYVSDATSVDVLAGMRRLLQETGSAAQIAHRLWLAARAGRFTMYTHAFYCTPLSFHHLPSDLAMEFQSASLVLLKGDLNYRRLVGDHAWPLTASFTEATAYFPAPLVVLRTLKSDVVLGLDEAVAAALDASGEAWRTDGTHGLIQARL